MTDGIVVIDKPLGMTSHDVVSRLRRCIGTRRIGHAGTLDPEASGVLVLGVGKATRLLTYLVGHDKDYESVIRLGSSTLTDDATGQVMAAATSTALAAVTDEQIQTEVHRLVGTIEQRPSSVSAVKVAGQRSYARVRAGEDVALPTRTVSVTKFDVQSIARTADGIDVMTTLTVSSGTYVRALARDLGAACGVGGHVRTLRRTRSGPFDLDNSHPLPEPGDPVHVMPLGEAMRRTLPTVIVSVEQAAALAHGRSIALFSADFDRASVAASRADGCVTEPASATSMITGDTYAAPVSVGALTADGQPIAVCRWRGRDLAPDIVFV